MIPTMEHSCSSVLFMTLCPYTRGKVSDVIDVIVITCHHDGGMHNVNKDGGQNANSANTYSKVIRK